MLEDIQHQILLEACSPNAKALRILNINKNIIASLNNPNKEDIIRITTILERSYVVKEKKQLAITFLHTE